MIYRLKNTIKNYDWGSKTLLSKYFDIENTLNQPQSELWMGAHPQASSKIEFGNELISLSQLLANSPNVLFKHNEDSKILPYLLKILAIEKPLSIQVHPTKSQAQIGFDKENAQNIPLNAPNRQFKDNNHKPELVYALTTFKAMNGFRCFSEIAELFKLADIAPLSSAVKQFANHLTSEGLKDFFSSLFLLNEHDLKISCEKLNQQATQYKLPKDCAEFVMTCYQHYQTDVGVFVPLFLHCVTLHAGQAMFLDAQTLHAYVSGLGVEIMASSDNVLRAGLTPKYINVNDLINHTQFIEKPKDKLLCEQVIINHQINFDIPVSDFNLQILSLNDNNKIRIKTSDIPEIVLCLEGEVTIQSVQGNLVSQTLSKGESALVSAQLDGYSIYSEKITSRVVRAYTG